MSRLLPLLLVGLALAACGGGDEPRPPFVPVLASSDTAIGPARLVLTLASIDELPDLDDAALQVRVLDETSAGLRFRDASEPLRVVASGQEYLIVGLEFDHAGVWAVEVVATRPDGERLASARLRLEVDAAQDVLRPGDDAVPSPTDTLADRPIAELSADPEPDPTLYAVSVRQALEQGRPFVVVFASTSICPRGPLCQRAVDQVKRLAAETGILAIHAQPFEAGERGEVLPNASGVLSAWSLANDPWIFVVDGGGVIVASLELVAGDEEVRDAIAQAVGAATEP